MECPGGKVAGALFFVAATQFVLGITIAESLYPGYSISGNYISDLGSGPSSMVFNSSAFLLGLLIAIGTYFLRTIPGLKIIRILFFLMALGAMGVGIFTQNFSTVHGAVATMAFFFSGLSAIASAKVLKPPFSLISIILGGMTIGALALFSYGIITSGSLTGSVTQDSIFYMGLGPGGMERMIVYPSLMWLAGFSIFLATKHEK